MRRRDCVRNLDTSLVFARRYRQMTMKCAYSSVEPQCSVLQHCVFILSTRFVRISGNGSIVSQNMEPLSLLSTFRGALTTRVMMNMLAIRYFFLMLETEESIFEIDNHHILQEAFEL